jgi:hypothetical protein
MFLIAHAIVGLVGRLMLTKVDGKLRPRPYFSSFNQARSWPCVSKRRVLPSFNKKQVTGCAAVGVQNTGAQGPSRWPPAAASSSGSASRPAHLERGKGVLGGLATYAHRLWVVIETPLHGLEYVLILPSSDQSLLGRSAAMLDGAALTGVGPRRRTNPRPSVVKE